LVKAAKISSAVYCSATNGLLKSTVEKCLLNSTVKKNFHNRCTRKFS
jgi:hypothetical protein